ncbi:hypothetical protein [Speluncibacter jeojiensis]|uniref:SUR7/PalI family protein n=1 Tax=Speluncibacter jeojiensis TaxID=2710754 RepID=A0A9X4RC50_9ACTN|nr:SUR7/PalI family protein [Corynebacteriales bacterium D3-21]
MLVVALAVTAIGFILLVVALVTGSVWFAWACIAVCIVGFILLIIDVLSNRRSAGDDDDGLDAAPAQEDVEAGGDGGDDAVTQQLDMGRPHEDSSDEPTQVWSAESSAEETTEIPRVTDQWQAHGSADSIGPADAGRHSAADDRDAPGR